MMMATPSLLVSSSPQLLSSSSLRRLLGLLVTVVALGLLVWTVRSQWSAVSDRLVHADFVRLALSLPWLLATSFVGPAIWQALLRRLGVRLPLMRAYALLHAAQLAKYLPGSIWSYVSIVYWAGEAKVPARVTVASMGAVLGFVTLGSVVVFAATLAWLRLGALGAILTALVGLALIEGGLRLAAHTSRPPRPASRVPSPVGADLVSARLPRPPVESTQVSGLGTQDSGLRIRRALAILPDALALFADGPGLLRPLVGIAFGYWALFAAGYYFVLTALDPSVDARTALVAAGYYAGAWLIGYYTMLTPGGLGVRELALAAFLATLVPGPLAAALPLVTRLWTLVGELLSGLLGLVLLRATSEESSVMSDE